MINSDVNVISSNIQQFPVFFCRNNHSDRALPTNDGQKEVSIHRQHRHRKRGAHAHEEIYGEVKVADCCRFHSVLLRRSCHDVAETAEVDAAAVVVYVEEAGEEVLDLVVLNVYASSSHKRSPLP